MSGYASKKEAVEVLKSTIAGLKTGLSSDPADYNMAGITRELVVGRGSYGWGIVPEEAAFHAALRKHRRKARL